MIDATKLAPPRRIFNLPPSRTSTTESPTAALVRRVRMVLRDAQAFLRLTESMFAGSCAALYFGWRQLAAHAWTRRDQCGSPWDQSGCILLQPQMSRTLM